MKPIFIFSLPRSGSTLLQRSLAAYPEIATTSEPWALLPGFFALRRQGIYGVYGHRSLVTAHEDLYSQMPNGIKDYYEVLQVYMDALYKKIAQGEYPYFLDKTPRYHLIANEIIDAILDAKFIFLWRNPLAVAASMIQTWGDGTKKYADMYYELLVPEMRELDRINAWHRSNIFRPHSQILQSWIEGGILAAIFFMYFGFQLIVGLKNIVLKRKFDFLSPLYAFILLISLWHLIMSPYAGHHRLTIAMSIAILCSIRIEKKDDERAVC